jgi:MinD-like ATPase involved in chromosome partitioning or flagellar assembly
VSSPQALDFDVPGGPVVAVCGLAGGAGTTTLAWLLAHQAARESAAPVLLGELPAVSGGLAALVSLADTRSFGRLMSSVAAGNPPQPAPVRGPDGLRVIASGPEAPVELPLQARHDALGRILAALRAAHGLVVLDCGVLQTADASAAVGLATHVVWVAPAGRSAGRRASALLTARALAPAPGEAREVLVVTAARPGPLAARTHRALRDLAGERSERLVLIPYVRELAAGRLGPGSKRLSTALAAIAGVLHLDAPAAPDPHRLPSTMEEMHLA